MDLAESSCSDLKDQIVLQLGERCAALCREQALQSGREMRSEEVITGYQSVGFAVQRSGYWVLG